MTIASLASFDLGYAPLNGSSVALSSQVVEEPCDAQSLSFDWLSLKNSGGVSPSAGLIQTMIGRVARDISNWLVTYPATPIDIEQEIAVLMPPKRQTMIKLHVKHAGRAMPLIILEDLYTDG